MLHEHLIEVYMIELHVLTEQVEWLVGSLRLSHAASSQLVRNSAVK